MTAQLVPTQGCYQKSKPANVVRETATLIIVEVAGRHRRFSKETMLHASPSDRQFPNYRLEILP